MRLETFQQPSTEIFVEASGMSATVNTWPNMEGCNLMVHGKDLSLRMAGSFRWEELAAVLIALTAARSA